MFQVLLSLLLLSLAAHTLADTVEVAVASNFATPIKSIATAFQKKTGHSLNPVTGASGKFYVQIQNAAPFEVFLSADDVIPAKLEQENLAVAGSHYTYATGRLVLWSAKPDLVDEQGNVLKGSGFAHLALANPKTAPYGAAAEAVLKTMGLLDNLRPKFVLGENIAQTQQFIASGNAELGFIALSQVEENGTLTAGGSLWRVPSSLHPAIRQDAVLLTRGKDKPAALAFMTYLKSPEAQAIIKRFGYE